MVPASINLNQLIADNCLKYVKDGKNGKIEVEYVENAAGQIENDYNTSIDDIVSFDQTTWCCPPR